MLSCICLLPFTAMTRPQHRIQLAAWTRGAEGVDENETWGYNLNGVAGWPAGRQNCSACYNATSRTAL